MTYFSTAFKFSTETGFGIISSNWWFHALLKWSSATSPEQATMYGWTKFCCLIAFLICWHAWYPSRIGIWQSISIRPYYCLWTYHLSTTWLNASRPSCATSKYCIIKFSSLTPDFLKVNLIIARRLCWLKSWSSTISILFENIGFSSIFLSESTAIKLGIITCSPVISIYNNSISLWSLSGCWI